MKKIFKIALVVCVSTLFLNAELYDGNNNNNNNNAQQQISNVGNQATTAISGVTSQISGVTNAITGVTGQINGAISGITNAFDFSSLTGSLNGSLASILSSISSFSSGLDGIFNSFGMGGLGNVLGNDNSLLGCLAGDMLSGIGGGEGGVGGGICSLLDIGGGGSGGFLDNKLLQCLMGAGGTKDTTSSDLNSMLSKYCNKENESSDAGTPSSGEDGYAEGGESFENGGTDENPATGGKNLDSSLVDVATSPQITSIGETDKDDGEEKELEERTAPNGKTMKELYSDEGGAIAKEASEHPDSSTGLAYRTLDIPTLELKKLVMNFNDEDKLLDETIYTLPATPLDAVKMENSKADLQAVGRFNLNDLQVYIVKTVREKYAEIDEKTLAEYYKKEKEIYAEFIQEDAEIKKRIKVAFETLDAKYALKLWQMTQEKGYIPYVSESRARNIPPARRNQYRFKAIAQMNKASLIKIQLALEKKELKEMIARTKTRAYYMSSVFRGDIVKKEIDEMLKAVDTAIK